MKHHQLGCAHWQVSLTVLTAPLGDGSGDGIRTHDLVRMKDLHNQTVLHRHDAVCPTKGLPTVANRASVYSMPTREAEPGFHAQQRGIQCGRRDSNSQPSRWQRDAPPIELLPQDGPSPYDGYLIRPH